MEPAAGGWWSGGPIGNRLAAPAQPSSPWTPARLGSVCLLTSTRFMFVPQPENVLRIIKPTPLLPTSQYSGNMFGFGGYSQQQQQAEEGGVLDLRTYKPEEPVPGQLTPPREEVCGSPGLSPTLALTQRVLAAASHPQAGTRPFKAYPKDPLSLSQDESYLRFREEMLAQVRGAKAQRRQPGSPSHSAGEGDGEKDAAYWERRRKNNEAAKRSRDARRAKEDEIAIRAAFLEQENLKLRYQIAAITEEYNHMRRAFYHTSHHHALQPIV